MGIKEQPLPSKSHTGKWILSGLIIVGAILLFGYVKCSDEPLLSITKTNEAKILISPEEIRQIEDIGQWVFLNVEAEEMVDTVRKYILKSDEALSRIYTGTLHFGVNLDKLKGREWFTIHGDTACLDLPAVELMDEEFINEAKTRTFYEVGEWDAETLKVLYEKAKAQMKERCITDKNLKTAQDNAEHEITTFIKSFGFNEVELSFSNF